MSHESNIPFSSFKFLLFLILASVGLTFLISNDPTEWELICDKLQKKCTYSGYDMWGRSHQKQTFSITPDTKAFYRYIWEKIGPRRRYKVYGVSISTNKKVFMFKERHVPTVVDDIVENMNYYFDSSERMFKYIYGTRSSFGDMASVIFLVACFLFLIMWLFNRPKKQIREI